MADPIVERARAKPHLGEDVTCVSQSQKAESDEDLAIPFDDTAEEGMVEDQDMYAGAPEVPAALKRVFENAMSEFRAVKRVRLG